MKKLIIGAASLLALAACAEPRQAPAQDVTKKQAQRVALSQAEAEAKVGAPRIVNYEELRTAVRIMEKRDSAFRTYSYYLAPLTGQPVKICDSIGYGIPYSTQTTNPERMWGEEELDGGAYSSSYRDIGGTIPQPEPNGLFIPDGMAATFVICGDPDGKTFEAVYFEPELIVSPFPIKGAIETIELRGIKFTVN